MTAASIETVMVFREVNLAPETHSIVGHHGRSRGAPQEHAANGIPGELDSVTQLVPNRM